MENSEAGNEELLVARSYKGCGKIHRRMRFMPKDEK